MNDPADTSTDTALALKRAVTSLSRTPCSRARLIERLCKQGFEPETAAHAASELEHLGYLDDRALAESVVRAILRKGPAGERLLVTRLIARGIERPLAQEVARQSLEPVDAQAEADCVAKIKVRSMKPSLDDATVARRVTSYLARRGLDSCVCREAVRKALQDRAGD